MSRVLMQALQPSLGMGNSTGDNATLSSNASLSVDHAMSFLHLSTALRHLVKSKLHPAKQPVTVKGKRQMSDKARKIVKVIHQQQAISRPQPPLASRKRPSASAAKSSSPISSVKSSSSSSSHPSSASHFSPLAHIVKAKLAKLPALVAPVTAAAVPVKGLAKPVEATASPMRN
uniref:Uncharacterized protein n=1 Tax=Hanusia phi TaxID=3032 RepID=A0A7S0HH31_9CRYP